MMMMMLQGGSGSVRNVQFSNIQVSEVQLPIVIDQFYCDKRSCRNQTAAVALSGINYENIRGSYTVKPVHLACSDNMPCTDVTLRNIELTAQAEGYHMYDPYCWQTFGQLYSPTIPPLDCLQIGKPSNNHIQGDDDVCWTLNTLYTLYICFYCILDCVVGNRHGFGWPLIFEYLY